MTITKYEHACIVLEKAGKSLLIDPGAYTKTLPELTNLVGIIITHFHQDHFDEEILTKIYNQNPSAKVYMPPQTYEALSELESVEIIQARERVHLEPFDIDFYLVDHTPIHISFPHTQNLAVRIDDRVYYPGDSLYVPSEPVSVLGLPTSGPWLKMGDAIDFIHEINPHKIFPMHDALNSEIGEDIHNRILSEAGKQKNAEWIQLRPGDSVEV